MLSATPKKNTQKGRLAWVWWDYTLLFPPHPISDTFLFLSHSVFFQSDKHTHKSPKTEGETWAAREGEEEAEHSMEEVCKPFFLSLFYYLKKTQYSTTKKLKLLSSLFVMASLTFLFSVPPSIYVLPTVLCRSEFDMEHSWTTTSYSLPSIW